MMYGDNPNRSAPDLNTVDSYTVRAWPSKTLVQKDIPTIDEARSIQQLADRHKQGHIIEANLSNGHSFICAHRE